MEVCMGNAYDAIPMEKKMFFRYGDFAALVGISVPIVYRGVRDGKIRAARFSPRSVYIPRSELERFQQGMSIEEYYPAKAPEK
jgi:excisionase family DNA binding protein